VGAYLFRAASAPVFVRGVDWIPAMGTALLLLAAHVVWVLTQRRQVRGGRRRSVGRQAKRVAALRSRGVTGSTIDAKASRRTIRLFAGRPAVDRHHVEEQSLSPPVGTRANARGAARPLRRHCTRRGGPFRFTGDHDQVTSIALIVLTIIFVP
jgi:hypothetical protein